MQVPRKRLPISIETFSEIISGGYYYVDKTRFAHLLTEQGKCFFLSRPRRFGKSLFLDTLKELFEGNQPLFAGLAIHDKWDWSRKYPVVSISFADGALDSRAALDEKIRELLLDNQERLGVVCSHQSISGQFAQLIRLARKKHGERVVVLIDEYDKPMLDNVSDSRVALAVREGLKNLYSVIKKADADIHFAFLAGVSKFSKVSLFSGLNSLRDISLSPEFSALCGYTDQELDTVFGDELVGLDRDEVRHWYNGYNWLGESVYNPYDVLLLLQERKFRPWWFESATPTFLIQLLTARQAWLPALGKMEADANLLAAFEVDKVSTVALMFQSGYLTIEREERLGGKYYYQLRFPNEEVRQSLYGCLLANWTADSGAEVHNTKALYQLMANNEVNRMRELFQAFFASIPHYWFTKNTIADFEGYYASVFYAYFVAAGLDVRAEDVTSFGRIDMAVRLPGHIYLFEFKVVEAAPGGAALQQIKDKKYADKYRADGLPIHLIGVEFSRDSRNVVGFEAELA
jgi:hypothetical protein